MPRTLRTLRKLLTTLASQIGKRNAKLEVKWMLQKVSHRPHVQDVQCRHVHAAHLAPLIQRRIAGEPIQYILGTQPFGPLDLLVRPPILIPRPETEDWVIRLAKHIRSTLENHVTLLDLCTGSGCIPLLLCHLLPPGSVRSWGTDVSPSAIALALDNAARCGISAAALMRERPHNTFEPFEADILSPTFPDRLRRLGPFDLLTSNPPYIPKREYDLLSKSVRDYEDPRALLGDPPGLPTQFADGLSFYHAIARLVNDEHVLKRGGLVVLEVGDGQARAVEEIMQREGGLHRTLVWLDLWGKQRVVLGHK